ncbi:glycogen debranching enzyme N-terminal domain-containing protein [Dysgonomonas sp. 520]|uniref:glycogen debranching enzyme N-terminal domain-containing protein n=1 Tax=Dysgonomonas sp. 520 TaxID=2302931 RepID=UPI0013D8D35E|nr:glycogen debranching enzyme N-terminal domain-containing protein [Dysgonomonas sp. 520]NDW08976.1 4-alpha-glucanotransferase [Dysgonomonas sp. 520]
MSYLKFDKTRMVNLEYSLNREILRTNRRGAYHCTTLVECNTRKQHGLLVMPVPNLDESNHVLLSSFDETVIQRGAEFNLGIHKYDGEHYSPLGHKYIREFDCESCPKTIYRIGGVILSKEKLFSLEENNILIRYTLLEAHSPTTLRFRPFLAFRSINELTHENGKANLSYQEIENGISTCMYDGYPNLYMQFSKPNSFNYNPLWNKGIEYSKDMELGFEYKEDLYVPGYFEVPIEKGETIVFSASDKPVKTGRLVKQFDEEIERRTPRSSFYNCLKNSAHQFYIRPTKSELYLLRGYPWFGVEARDQFMSLPGLTMSIGRNEAFEEVINTARTPIYQFLENRPVTGLLKGLDKPDVLLWVIWAIKKFFLTNKDTCLSKYSDLVKDIMRFIMENKHPNLHLEGNNLLWCNGKDISASWMDTTFMGRLITPRTGFLVEVNALWYNALMVLREFMEHDNDDEQQIREIVTFTETVRDSFLDTFVNNAGYLFDYVDGTLPDWQVRPNMVIAIAMDYSPLTRRQSKSVLDMVTKELLTPKGIRTLSPKSEGYQPYFEGSQHNRDYAYSNGTAWPFLLGHFFEAYIKIHQRSGISFIERMLITIEEEMANNCIGSLSQLYDGNPPYTGRAAFSYAPSVAGVLRAMQLKDKLEEELDNE